MKTPPASNASSPTEPTGRAGALRVGTSLLLAATALLWVWGGTAWMPPWLATAGARAGLDELRTGQLLVGVMIAAAATIALLGVRCWAGLALARVSILLLAFASVASIAAELARPGGSSFAQAFLLPGAVAVAALLLHGTVDGVARQGRIALRSPGWSVLLVLAIATASVGIAARTPLAPSGRAAPKVVVGDDSVVLDPVPWQGRTLPDTPLSRLLPLLTPLTLEGDSVIVLYNPNCGHCRELFEKHFAVAVPGRRVIAVEVPPAPGSFDAAGDDLGPVPCAECERLMLPPGPAYLLKPPTLVVVRAGRVLCATDNDPETCLAQLASQTPAP